MAAVGRHAACAAVRSWSYCQRERRTSLLINRIALYLEVEELLQL